MEATGEVRSGRGIQELWGRARRHIKSQNLGMRAW